MPDIRSLDTLLENAPETARVMAHARRLLKVGRLYQAVVPDTLARISRVANVKSGIVVIHAETGAAAAKIRQIAGRLAGEFSKRGVECSGIEVRVQPSASGPSGANKCERTLTEAAASSLKNARDALPEGAALRGALNALLKAGRPA